MITSSQIFCARLAKLGPVPKSPNGRVTWLAENPANLAGFMVVVDAQPMPLRVLGHAISADRAPSILQRAKRASYCLIVIPNLRFSFVFADDNLPDSV
jgi:hypothetical protein